MCSKKALRQQYEAMHSTYHKYVRIVLQVTLNLLHNRQRDFVTLVSLECFAAVRISAFLLRNLTNTNPVQ